MTSQEAQATGRIKILKATVIIVAAFLFVFMLMETRGDFANGILFFFQEISNIHFIVILIILFGLTYIFGGIAGREIILYKKNIALISLKYAVLIVLSIVMYAAVVGISTDNTSSSGDFQRLLEIYFFRPLVKTVSLTIIPMFLIWLWATYQMRLIRDKKND